MKKCLFIKTDNKKGSAALLSLFIGFILIFILMSAYARALRGYKGVISGGNAVNAAYMAETAMEEALFELNRISYITASSYLNDLREHKLNYLEHNGNYEEQLPLFHKYIQLEFIPQLVHLNKYVTNPFDYPLDHYYKTSVEYFPFNKSITVKAEGGYSRSRKFINAVIEMPYAYQIGSDPWGLPLMEISSFKVSSQYQTFGL